MKIIFLDIDGVLNADDDGIYISGPNKGKSKLRSPHICGFTGIDYKKVKKLAKIVQATDAKVVLVSSWKTCYEQYKGNPNAHETMLSPVGAKKMGKYLVDKLLKEGVEIYGSTFSAERYIDEDGIWRTVGRGRGVRRWLVANKDLDIEEWIALDDEKYGYEEEQYDHLIQTDPSCYDYNWKSRKRENYRRGGLNDADVARAIDYLNNGVPSGEAIKDDQDV